MSIPDFFQLLRALNPYEAAGFVAGIAGVVLAARQNIWTWPVSLVGVLISMVVFYQSRFYSDVALQVFYIVITAYGWYSWLYGGKNKTELPASQAPAKVIFGVIAAGILVSPVIGFLSNTYTNADAPYLDAALAVFSVLATLLLGRKLIENWLFWIVIDVLYTGLFFSKGVYLYSLLYLIFAVLAVFGYLKWKKEIGPWKTSPSE